eukprot:scaffold3074_cov108-Ochromonas_danica.AAC.1
MSVIWLLPEDILHSIYSEWLEWKDLSMLDIACVEKNEREEWLTSLSDLKMTQRLEGKGFIFDHNMSIFYKWLKSHKVLFVEEFPVRLTVLKDLMGELSDMESLCSGIRSIVINDSANIYDKFENDLSVFLSHCHNLQGVTARMDDKTGESCVIIWRSLVETVRENSLVKISLLGELNCRESHVMIANFLSKHASSLQDLNLCESREIDLIMSTLIANQIHLTVLTISPGINCSQTTSSLISYLSSAGDMLEVLDIGYSIDSSYYMYFLDGSFAVNDLVLQVSRCCPKLTRFVIQRGKPCSMESLLCLFEQCPHLQHVSIPSTIETDGKSRSLSINVIGTNDDWAVSLSHALRSRQYKRVTLTLEEDNYNQTVGNLKFLLEPFEIHLYGRTSEISLISLLQDLPHLNTLCLDEDANYHYTDAALSAITKHAKCLTEWTWWYTELGTCFSDNVVSELIAACQSLKKLSVWIPISGSGFESLVAVSKHSSLNEISLTMDESVSEEMFDEFLLDEKVQWPPTLKEGYIGLFGRTLCYEFNQESHQWIKHG